MIEGDRQELASRRVTLDAIKDSIRRRPAIYNLTVKSFVAFTKGKLRIALHRVTRGGIARRVRIEGFLIRNDVRFLQVGGGYSVITSKNWLNGDIIAGDIFLDATKSLPLPDESLDGVFAEQFLEHLSLNDSEAFLMSVVRCLKPGGIIRLATPDLALLIKVYLGQNPDVSQEQIIERHFRLHRPREKANYRTMARVLNDQFTLWGHQFIFDYETIEALLAGCGFVGIQRVKFGKSRFGPFQNLERHADTTWMRDGYQLIIEARKELA